MTQTASETGTATPAAAGELAADRRVFRITGADRESFLQGLVTNDLRKLAAGPVYAAFLTAQGKYLADFLLVPDLVPDGEAILLDIKDSIADAFVRRLSMYRLRADVQIAATGLKVWRGLGPAPVAAVPDPRDARLGWRLYTEAEGHRAAEPIDWDAIRVAACIPETGIELIPDDTYILEAGFERLNGVDFRKGCYVGQEVTARMKHKTELRKGFRTVQVEGAAPVGTEILAGGKPAGKLFTQSGGQGIAFLRLDRAQGEMLAGEARVRLAD